MADTKLSALTELDATPASDDELYIRDVSEAAASESKRITTTNLLGGVIAKATLTTRGDILYRNATVPARLAKGAANTVMVMGANDPAWSATLAGLTLTSPTINGTIATTGLTLPAITFGGTVTLNGQVFDAGASYLQMNTTGNEVLKLQSTNDGSAGSQLNLISHSASLAVNDKVGTILGIGYNSDTEDYTYGQIEIRQLVSTAGSEDGRIVFLVAQAGVLSAKAYLHKDGRFQLTKDITFTSSADSGAVADSVALGGFDISAGHRALAISSEEVVVVETDETKFSHKLPVRINGATYNIMLCAT